MNRPINQQIPSKKVVDVYETVIDGVEVTLVRKENGGKADALNVGINAARYPYFICMDADSVLQRDSLKEIVKPVLQDDTIVAVGGPCPHFKLCRFEAGRACGLPYALESYCWDADS